MGEASFAIFNFVLIIGTAVVGIRLYLRRQPDVSGVKGSRMLGSGIRAWYFSNLTPFEDLFVRSGVSPTALTYAQLTLSPLVALAYAQGLIFTAGWLVLATGTLDILDGRVARRTNASSPAGAFLDSVVDRYTEFIGLLGLLIYFDSGWVVWAILFFILGSMMVSYTRARAEGLGASCDVGLLQRPERFVLLGFGSIFSSVLDRASGESWGLLALTILILAVLSNITALQRLAHVRRALNGAKSGE